MCTALPTERQQKRQSVGLYVTMLGNFKQLWDGCNRETLQVKERLTLKGGIRSWAHEQIKGQKSGGSYKMTKECTRCAFLYDNVFEVLTTRFGYFQKHVFFFPCAYVHINERIHVIHIEAINNAYKYNERWISNVLSLLRLEQIIF